eukprot:TRINITY_DN4135_c0_g1_i4.p1 TRINITY_DN4135_c0_g1~~TRINITY_DN4135_c0_g1_i4.p1  ORF type:complete len:324 (-),score=91.80 TRINITY_DN4135_c0_g1_i4:200-1171(-)
MDEENPRNEHHRLFSRLKLRAAPFVSRMSSSADKSIHANMFFVSIASQNGQRCVCVFYCQIWVIFCSNALTFYGILHAKSSSHCPICRREFRSICRLRCVGTPTPPKKGRKKVSKVKRKKFHDGRSAEDYYGSWWEDDENSEEFMDENDVMVTTDGGRRRQRGQRRQRIQRHVSRSSRTRPMTTASSVSSTGGEVIIIEDDDEDAIVIEDEDMELTRTPLMERVRRRMMENTSQPRVSELSLSPTHPVHAGVAGRRRHQQRIQEAIQRYRMRNEPQMVEEVEVVEEVDTEVELDMLVNEDDFDGGEGWEFVSEDVDDEDEILF